MRRYRSSTSNIVTSETLQAMIDELVRLCDLIEQHGLVDYDRGVWEEEIVSLFSQCVDLLEPGETAASGPAQSHSSSRQTWFAQPVTPLALHDTYLPLQWLVMATVFDVVELGSSLFWLLYFLDPPKGEVSLLLLYMKIMYDYDHDAFNGWKW